jgi:hypothetical protein
MILSLSLSSKLISMSLLYQEGLIVPKDGHHHDFIIVIIKKVLYPRIVTDRNGDT